MDSGYTVTQQKSTQQKSTAEQELMESTNINVGYILESLMISPTYIKNLREQLKADSVCSHHDAVHRRKARARKTGSCAEQLPISASYTHSERLIVERKTACNTLSNMEQCSSQTTQRTPRCGEVQETCA